MVQTVLVAVDDLGLVHGDVQDDADQVDDSGQKGRLLQIGREMMVRTISWGLIVVKRFCRNKKSFSSQREGFIYHSQSNSFSKYYCGLNAFTTTNEQNLNVSLVPLSTRCNKISYTGNPQRLPRIFE